jgi:hypothetical protein
VAGSDKHLGLTDVEAHRDRSPVDGPLLVGPTFKWQEAKLRRPSQSNRPGKTQFQVRLSGLCSKVQFRETHDDAKISAGTELKLKPRAWKIYVCYGIPKYRSFAHGERTVSLPNADAHKSPDHRLDYRHVDKLAKISASFP